MPHKNNTKALRRARQMPRLRHALPDTEFVSANSEALNWLCSQPELRDAIFTLCNYKHAIVYDKADGTWRGADTP